MEKLGLEAVFDTSQYSKGLQTYTSGLQQANSVTEHSAGVMGKLGNAAKGVGGLLKGALSFAGGELITRGLDAVTSGFTDSLKAAGDFEAGMNRFSAVMGGSLASAGLSTETFRNLFLKLGADTQFSAAQAQEAAINLAKGGLDPLTISGSGLKGTLDLAAAAEMDLGMAAEITAKQLGIWADTGVTGADVANLLSQAANASTVDVDELALGLANAGGSAKTAGVTFKDLTTTMALLAPGFSSASDAGTSLKTFLSRMIPTTKAQTAAMKELGLITKDGTSKFFDATGTFIGMEKASQLLQNSLKGYTNEQKLATLQAIFGQDALRAAAILAESGAEGYNKMAESMTAAGTAAEQAAKRQQGFAFAQEQLAGSLETLQIVIGSAIIPLLTDLLNNIIVPGVNAVMGFASAFFAASDKVSFLRDALEKIIPGAGIVFDVFTEIGNAISVFYSTLASGKSTLESFAQALFSIGGDDTPAVLVDIGRAAQQLGGMLDIAKQAVTDFVSKAIPELQRFGDNIIGALTTGDTGPLVAQVKEWADIFLNWATTDVIPFIGAQVDAIARAIGDWVTQNVPGLVSKLEAWGSAVLDFLTTSVIPFIGEKVNALVAALGNWISTNAPILAEKLGVWGDAFLDWVATDALPFIGEKLGALVTAVGGWISQNAPVIASKLAEWGKAFIDWVATDALPFIAEKLGALFTAVSGWVSEQVGPLGSKLGEWAGAFLNWVATDVLPFLAEKLGTIFTAVSGWVGEQAGPLAEKLGEWAGAFLNFIGTSVIPFIGEKIGQVATEIGKWIETEGPNILANLGVWGEQFGKWIGDKAIPWLIENFPKIVETLAKLIIAIPLALAAAIGTFANGVVTGMQESLAEEFRALPAQGAEFIAKIQEGLESGTIQADLEAAIAEPLAALQLTWDTTWPLMKATLDTTWADIKLALETAWNNFKTFIATNLGLIQTNLDTAMAGLKSKWDTAWNDVKLSVEGIWTRISEFFDGLPASMLTFGKNLIQGFIDGIGSMANAVVQAILNLLPPALRSLASQLGIGSPSKVMMRMGDFMMQGLAVGISKGGQAAVSAFNDVQAAILSQAESGPVVQVAARMSMGRLPGMQASIPVGRMQDSMGSILSLRESSAQARTAAATNSTVVNINQTFNGAADSASVREGTVQALRRSGIFIVR